MYFIWQLCHRVLGKLSDIMMHCGMHLFNGTFRSNDIICVTVANDIICVTVALPSLLSVDDAAARSSQLVILQGVQDYKWASMKNAA